MSVRNRGTRTGWVLMLLALGFLLATCSSNKAVQKPATRASQATTETQAATTPEAAKESSGAQSEAAGETGGAQRMGAETTPLGDRVEIRKSWVQVRAKPSEDAAAIALAFGNDTYPVVGHQGDWVHVRLDHNREGWIPVSATQP